MSVSDSSLQPDAMNLTATDDSSTEPDLNSSQSTAAAVSPDRLGSCSSDNEKLPSATMSRLSPMQSIRRSSLREIPEDEIRRSGVSNLSIVLYCGVKFSCLIFYVSCSDHEQTFMASRDLPI